MSLHDAKKVNSSKLVTYYDAETLKLSHNFI